VPYDGCRIVNTASSSCADIPHYRLIASYLTTTAFISPYHHSHQYNVHTNTIISLHPILSFARNRNHGRTRTRTRNPRPAITIRSRTSTESDVIRKPGLIWTPCPYPLHPSSVLNPSPVPSSYPSLLRCTSSFTWQLAISWVSLHCYL
jgi:hypothetical protein